MNAAGRVTVVPLTPERWPDLERLFGERGALDGCWCMWFRQDSAKYKAGRGEVNRKALEAIVATGSAPGLLAYVDGAPAGWCAVAPRAEYPRLQRSRITKPVDAQPVWAVVCFFIPREQRGRGLAETLLRAAVEYAVAHGARIVEGYPVDPGEDGKVAATSGFHGFASTFARVGFVEVARRDARRLVMRWVAESSRVEIERAHSQS